MNIKILQIACDMPDCIAVFQGQFVDNDEKVKLWNSAKRDGWRQVRIGDHMSDICGEHPEIF